LDAGADSINMSPKAVNNCIDVLSKIMNDHEALNNHQHEEITDNMQKFGQMLMSIKQ
jgi:hypothetical protein